MIVRTSTLACLAVPLALLVGPAAAAESPSELLDRPDARWNRGPVRYLIEKEEDAAFRKIKTDEERRDFILKFWARRDPSPGTERNEFRELFEKRLAVVAQRFSPPNGRGWEEDRGRAVLLLGPPDTVETSQSEEAAGGGAAEPGGPGAPEGSGPVIRRRAVFTWNEPVLPGAQAPLRLEFMEEGGGGFRMLGRYDFSDPRLTGIEHLPVPVAEAPKPPEPPPAPEPPPPPPPAPPTPQEELLAQILDGPTPPQKLGIAARMDYFKTSESGTLATLTVAVRRPASGDAPPLIAARVLRGGEEAVMKLERAESFAGAAENASTAPGGDALYQAAQNLDPGTYSVIAAAKDATAGDVGFVMQDLVVPDFHGDALQVSSVTLAKKVDRAATPSTDGSERFVMGNYRVLPSPRGEFKGGEDLWLYYQIYNTANDPVSGRPKLKVSYRFEKVEKTGNRIIGGKPIEQTVNSNVQIYAVPIGAVWPAGAYQVTVKIDDLTSGTSVSSIVPFTVVK